MIAKDLIRTPDKDKEIARRVFNQSLFHTCKYGLSYEDINVRAHGDLIDALEAMTFGTDNIDSVLGVMPRGSLKSSICSVGFPIWRLNRDFNERIMLDSSVFELSSAFVTEIARRLEDGILPRLFGNYKTREDWSSRSLTIAQRTKVYKEPSIFASGVGSPKVGFHPTLIVHDDMNSDKNSTTPELRLKVFEHYRMNYAILEPGGHSVVVGTRYAADDLIGKILENEIGESMLPDYLKASVG
jgi:hypothetical protein